jgi:hypothetical protein
LRASFIRAAAFGVEAVLWLVCATSLAPAAQPGEHGGHEDTDDRGTRRLG